MVAVPRPAHRPRIVRAPAILGADPCVEGTRVSVAAVVIIHQACKGHLTCVYRKLPTLPPGGAEAALDYYAQHKAEIDHQIEEDEQAAYL